MKLRHLIIAVGLLAVVALGAWVGLRVAPPPADMQPARLGAATLLPQPRTLAPFQLTDHRGEPVTAERLKGQWSLMFFGYTHCPDICPTTLAMLNVVDATVRERLGDKANLKVIFVSVDPERDTLGELSEYVPYFNKRFTGATGEPQQLETLARQLGIVFTKVTDDPSGKYYLVDHSASIVIIDPQGRWHGVFTPPHEPQAISDAMVRLLGPAG